VRLLPPSGDQLPVEITQMIDLDSYRMQKTHEGKIDLARGVIEVPPIAPEGMLPHAEEIEILSKIIKELNERFGTDFSEDDKVFLRS
jgi:type I restriction enzyme R subunit